MASLPSALPIDRPRLKQRLQTDLRKQTHDHQWHSANLEQLRELEARIQATAQQLEPSAPQAAVHAARRKLAYDDLANQLLRRAELPDDPIVAPEPLRIRTQHLESKILDLARELEPLESREAIARATTVAHRHLSSQWDPVRPDPTGWLDAARRRLAGVSRRLGRLAAAPKPSQQQRVDQTLTALRRLERLEADALDFGASCAALPHRGNVYELEAALQSLPDPRGQLDASLEVVFRHPARARQRLSASYRRTGELATLQRFAEDPAAFGRLRGRQLPLLGATQERTEALEAAGEHARAALRGHDQHSELEGALDSVRSYHKLQALNRELIAAFPGRQSLLSELGRNMAGLELDEVRPLLMEPGQAKLAEEVRLAEQQFLEPLQAVTGMFLKPEASGASALSRPAVQAKAQRIAALFRYAPHHILNRLTPPQMQGALVAVAIARRVVKAVTRRVAL